MSLYSVYLYSKENMDLVIVSYYDIDDCVCMKL